MNRIFAAAMLICLKTTAVAEPVCQITQSDWDTFSDLTTWAQMEDHVCRGLVHTVDRGGRTWGVMQWVVVQDEGFGLAAVAFDTAGTVTETVWDPNKMVAPDGTVTGFFGPVQVRDTQEMEDQG